MVVGVRKKGGWRRRLPGRGASERCAARGEEKGGKRKENSLGMVETTSPTWRRSVWFGFGFGLGRKGAGIGVSSNEERGLHPAGSARAKTGRRRTRDAAAAAVQRQRNNAQRMVVLPALSRPRTRMRASWSPNRLSRRLIHSPITSRAKRASRKGRGGGVERETKAFSTLLQPKRAPSAPAWRVDHRGSSAYVCSR